MIVFGDKLHSCNDLYCKMRVSERLDTFYAGCERISQRIDPVMFEITGSIWTAEAIFSRDTMKQVDEAPSVVEVPRSEESTLPQAPDPQYSRDQDDFDRSFRAGTRAMGELLRSRRKKK